MLLRGAPPCRHNRHHRSHDSHSSASSHCGGAVAEVFGRTPAIGEAVVGIVASETRYIYGGRTTDVVTDVLAMFNRDQREHIFSKVV